MVKGSRSRIKKILLVSEAVTLIVAALICLTSTLCMAEENIVVKVSLGEEAGSKVLEVPVTVSDSYVNGSLEWMEGTIEHEITLGGTLEKGLDGKPRIIMNVTDDWYRPSGGEGDPGT